MPDQLAESPEMTVRLSTQCRGREMSDRLGKAGPAADHLREQRSVLAELERKALIWLARRIPPWANSDHLTLLAFASMVGAGAAFALARRAPWCLLLVDVALAANWFGDSLDGTLARVRGHERPRYGYYTDHVLDLAGMTALSGGMVLSGYMHPLLGMALLAAFLLVSAESYLATHALGVFRISCFGFGPTELRIILGVGAIRLLRDPFVHVAGLGPFKLFDVGGLIALAGLVLVFVVSASRNVRELYRQEPLPHDAR
jgi:archaetidylinositol phosphate synthase